jgi:hypothetical protein
MSIVVDRKHLRDREISVTISDMKRSIERGFSVLIVPLAISSLLLIGAVVFGAWAYSKMEDYKNNVDAKVDTAAAAAKQQEATTKDAQFAQEEKYPLRSYVSPAAYGNITVQFPKTWSGYVSDDTNGSPFIDGYFYPDTVPDIQNQNNTYALRIQLMQESYSEILQEEQNFVQQGQATVVPYTAPKVPSVVGVKVTGALLTPQTNGTMIIFPLRNMTLLLWTGAPQFEDDFNNIILPNFTFSP